MSVDDILKAEEGLRLSPYLDSRNLWTVGYGRCLETNPLTGEEWRSILNLKSALALSQLAADALFDRDRAVAEQQCRAALDFWDQLNEPRQAALISMCFQMGIQGLRGFRNALAAMRSGDWETAEKAMLDSEWARQTPQRAERMARMIRLGVVS